MVYNVNLGRTGLLDIDKIINAGDIPNHRATKPNGCLWASRPDCDYGWEAWCKENQSDWLSVEHAEVEISDNARILKIDSEEAFDRLLCCGADIGFRNLSKDTRYDLAANTDWANISKHYDVIEFRLDDYYEPRYILGNIDCDSVAILNKDVITEIRNPATVTLRKEADRIEIESVTTYIGEYEFAGYANVKSVVIPEGVTEIGVGAFLGCTSLENVSFPSTLKKIERRAFDNCPNLREVILPDGLDELGDSAFIECRFVKTGHWDKEYDKPETITEYNAIMYRGINLVNNVKPLQSHYDEETLYMEDAFELVKQSVQPEITINSTDEERTEILSKKKLVIAPWDQSKELVITDPNESTAKALKRYSIEIGLKGKDISFSEFHSPVTFTQSTLKESITQMSKRGANLVNLGKLMSALEPVCNNAIKIEVEPYRHVSRKGQEVKQVHQMLSAFHDGEKAYPVKITIHEKEKQKDQFYMVVTVGEIDISAKLKEALTNTGADHPEMNGSLSDGGASFVISIPAFVADFKRNESIIIKNLPDGLLNNEQRDIKQRVLETDAQKETEVRINLSSGEMKQLKQQGFTEEEIATVVENIDNIIKISSAQIDNVKQTLSDNRESIRIQAKEQTLEMQRRSNMHIR